MLTYGDVLDVPEYVRYLQDAVRQLRTSDRQFRYALMDAADWLRARISADRGYTPPQSHAMSWCARYHRTWHDRDRPVKPPRPPVLKPVQALLFEGV